MFQSHNIEWYKIELEKIKKLHYEDEHKIKRLKELERLKGRCLEFMKALDQERASLLQSSDTSAIGYPSRRLRNREESKWPYPSALDSPKPLTSTPVKGPSRKLFKTSSSVSASAINHLLNGTILADFTQLPSSEDLFQVNESPALQQAEEEEEVKKVYEEANATKIDSPTPSVDSQESPLLFSSDSTQRCTTKSTLNTPLTTPKASKAARIIETSPVGSEYMERVKFCYDLGHIDHQVAWCGMCDYMYRDM